MRRRGAGSRVWCSNLQDESPIALHLPFCSSILSFFTPNVSPPDVFYASCYGLLLFYVSLSFSFVLYQTIPDWPSAACQPLHRAVALFVFVSLAERDPHPTWPVHFLHLHWQKCIGYANYAANRCCDDFYRNHRSKGTRAHQSNRMIDDRVGGGEEEWGAHKSMRCASSRSRPQSLVQIVQHSGTHRHCS